MERSEAYSYLFGLLVSRNEAISDKNSLQVSIDLLLRRQSEMQDRVTSIDADIFELLVCEGVQSIETPIGKPTRIKGKPTVEVIDISAIPPQFKVGTAKIPFAEIPAELVEKFDITVNKNLVATAFKDGDVPGAQMLPGKEYLRIM